MSHYEQIGCTKKEEKKLLDLYDKLTHHMVKGNRIRARLTHVKFEILIEDIGQTKGGAYFFSISETDREKGQLLYDIMQDVWRRQIMNL